MLNIIAFIVLGITCFVSSIYVIDFCQEKILETNIGKDIIVTYKWLAYGTFVLQCVPWLALFLGYTVNKREFDFIENLWPLTRTTLFCMLSCIILVGIISIFEKAKEKFSNGSHPQ